MAMMKAAYQRRPDLHLTVEDVIAEGDKVMVGNTWRATETDSRKKIEFHGFVLWRFANKRMVDVGRRSLRRKRFRKVARNIASPELLQIDANQAALAPYATHACGREKGKNSDALKPGESFYD